MVDCGRDWLGRLGRVSPTLILLTHAHPDHARGFAEGARWPVYATAETWALIGHYPFADRKSVEPGRSFRLGPLVCRAFAVEHSVRAPAVGYRFTLGDSACFYVPDVVAIGDRHTALAGVQLYIGDGARIARPLLRQRDGMLIGHPSIRTQLDWCQEDGVEQAIFTHCGSEIVSGNARSIAARVRGLAGERGVAARIAFDGMRLVLDGEASP